VLSDSDDEGGDKSCVPKFRKQILDDRTGHDKPVGASPALGLDLPLLDPSNLCLQGSDSLLQRGLFLFVCLAHRMRLQSRCMSLLPCA
jgi:hypothetical protein